VVAKCWGILKANIVDIASYKGSQIHKLALMGGFDLENKCLHVALCQISSFFGSPTPYKKHECQKTFLQDMVFLIAKGFFYLSTCKNLWMQCLAL
jgi:hypothetical protein